MRGRNIRDDHPCVDLRRAKSGMTEKALHVGDVSTPGKHMRGTRMPEDVRRDPFANPGGGGMTPHDLMYPAGV